MELIFVYGPCMLPTCSSHVLVLGGFPFVNTGDFYIDKTMCEQFCLFLSNCTTFISFPSIVKLVCFLV